LIEKGVFGHMDSNDRIFVRERGVIVGTWDVSVVRDYKGLARYKQNSLARGERGGGQPGGELIRR
jgi:hypothetical protein